MTARDADPGGERHPSGDAAGGARSQPGYESGESVPVISEPLIQGSPQHCQGCAGCLRACPVKAIRLVGERAEIIEEKCVSCGACVAACATRGFVVRDDLPRLRRLLAGDRHVVALLASEFVAAMHPLEADEIEAALEAVGFYAVESTVLGEELVALEYERLYARSAGLPALRSTCPVAVDYVRRFEPSLVGALAPIVPPYVAEAKLVKALYPDDVAVAYVSPCYARKDEFMDPEFDGAVDAAIDFFELKSLISDAVPDWRTRLQRGRGVRRPEPLKELSLTDGFPRSTLATHTMDSGDVSVVRGLGQMSRFLSALGRGETAPSIADLLNCEGCIDGPTVSPGLSVFAKRTLESAAREQQPRATVRTRELLTYLPTVDLVRSFKAKPFVAPVPDDDTIDTILREGEFASRDEVIDCGACGYSTCVEHAVAIWRGDSTWQMCHPLQARRMLRSIDELSALATIDPLTGLWNRRVFVERLSEEISRFDRYSSPLSLLMIDMDGFKSLNDTCGHAAGDDALRLVGRLLTAQFRAADIASRYGGDEFAVILPGTNKTEAFAAAEKLRVAIDGLELRAGGGPDSPFVTASVGVASAGAQAPDAERLLEAADRALYRAKASGRDSVVIAPG
jgi:diguanylate cyclase (GGDEF)-like protein